MTSLMPRLPPSFTLRSKPVGAEYDVVFATPTEERTLGRFSPSDLNASILLQLFPDWKPSGMVKLGLTMLRIPPQFSMTARPAGAMILFSLQLDVPGGPPRTWNKTVAIEDWTLAQMRDVASFLNTTPSSPQPRA